MGESPAPGAITLAVVRQDQISAAAVVTATGQEWSVLSSPATVPRGARPQSGDLVAVQDGQIVYYWYRALVLGVTPDGVRLRLSNGTQVVVPVNAGTLDADTPLRIGDPVFASTQEIIASAWPWYEPQPVAPALQKHATAVVQALQIKG